MRIRKRDLEEKVKQLNELLKGEEYFLEVLDCEVFGRRCYRLWHRQGGGMPLCTWDCLSMSDIYQYLRGIITTLYLKEDK